VWEHEREMVVLVWDRRPGQPRGVTVMRLLEVA